MTDLADYYDHDEREINRMIHSSGPERRYMAVKRTAAGAAETKAKTMKATTKATIQILLFKCIAVIS